MALKHQRERDCISFINLKLHEKDDNMCKKELVDGKL